jgi:single-stranded DNA-binding protein
MSYNKSGVNGRLPFDLEVKGAEGKEVVVSKISVKRNYKPEGEQYYPEDLIPFKVFGAKAKFLANNFPKNSNVILDGELRVDADWEKEGVTQKGEMYLHVNEVYFPEGNPKGGAAEGGSAPAKAPATKTPAKTTPAAPAKKVNPFAK